MISNRISDRLSASRMKFLLQRGKYISLFEGLDTVIRAGRKKMPLDSDTKIGKLKDIAIGRCRERLEQAACKATQLMNKPIPERQDIRERYYDKSAGIASFLKRKHGL